MKKIIVIGGGVIGLCCAYYLVKDGHEVTVVDQGDMTTGASYINAGYLTPSHFTPLAEPGVITQGLKWMLDSSSPFYIKPHFDLEFFRWAWDFKKSATTAKVKKATPVLIEINLKSRDLYDEMLASADFEFHYERKGLLMVYQTEKSEEHELKLAERAAALDLEAIPLSRKQLQEIEPVFNEKVIGAVHWTCDAHTTPHQFMLNLKNWLKDNGTTFRANEEIKGFEKNGDKIISVKTATENLEADEFVLATGSWTSVLAKSLGLRIPIQGGKGYSMSVNHPTGITMPAILTEARMAVTPMYGLTRFAGTMEFSGNNNIVHKHRVEAIARGAEGFYKDLKITDEEKASAVSGLRPVSPDGLPYIGRTSKYNNLYVASGHAMMGWSLGPITGKLIAQVISGEKTLVGLEPFRVERF